MDSDLYESARCVFENLQDRIVPGTVIVFDEYFNYPNWQAHEFERFRSWFEARERYEYLAYARIQVAVKITAVERPNSAVEALHHRLSRDLEGQPA